MAQQVNNGQTNLIINYLPQTLTDGEFRHMFESIGPLQSSKICRDKRSNYSYGFGFVDYVRPEDAAQAIRELNELPLQNKTIKVAYARPNNEETKQANIYIKGLPKMWTKVELERAFCPFGNIVQARVLSDQFTGMGRGKGFVLFEKHSEAEAAIANMNGAKLDDSLESLEIKYVDDSAKKVKPAGWSSAPMRPGFAGPIRTQSPRVRFNPLGGGSSLMTSGLGPSGLNNAGFYNGGFSDGFYGGSGGGGSAGVGRFGNGCRGNQDGFGSGARDPLPDQNGGFTLFVYNIGLDADEKMLWQLFHPCGDVLKATVVRDPEQNNKCKGYGFVTMSTYDEALFAIQRLNRFPFSQGKPLQVSLKKNS